MITPAKSLAFLLALALLLTSMPVSFAQNTNSDSKTTSVETIILGVPFEITLPTEARDIVIGDPKLIDSVITSSRKLILTGKETGLTTMTMSDRYGATLMTMAIRVSTNLDDLNDIIQSDLGISSVRVRSLKGAVIIGGSVSSSPDADKVVTLVRAYFGLTGATDQTSGAVRLVNTLKITDREQVMLRVVVSEVQRSLLKQLGVDTQGSWTLGDLSFKNATTFPTTRSPTSTFTPGIATSGSSGSATLKALERTGYLKTLAEPTLTAISGESAKFTAGGEIPVPTGEICSTNALGGQACQTNYNYKPIGVSLSFSPVVLSSGRISLRISTEVTEIDPDNGSRTATANIPAFRSRKMETTVELSSGSALMSAGLIQQQSSGTYDRVPGISAVPVLGQLFQSNDYQNHQTELLISVVPYIAKPFGALESNSADQEFTETGVPQHVVLNEVRRVYGLRGKIDNSKIGFEVPQ